MINLLAKNQSSGRYYFCEDDESVYFIKPPLKDSEMEFVDSLPVFLRKSFDSDLTFDKKEFADLEGLRTFAIRYCDPEKRGIQLNNQESLSDLLIYAPVEIVEEYFEMIEDMISRKEFAGLELFFNQLSKNFEVIANQTLKNKRNKLKISFDNARFPHVIKKKSALIAETRIRRSYNVLEVA